MTVLRDCLANMHHSSLADVNNTHPTFLPPIAHRPHNLVLSHALASLTTRTYLHLALSLLELDDRFDRLEVISASRRKSADRLR